MAGPIKPIASSTQINLGLEGEPEQLQRKKPADPGYKEVHEKHNPPEKDQKGKATENKEFEDKRAKSSPLIAKTEIERMKEILDKSSKSSGGGASGIPKTGKKPYDFKAGGKVSKALKSAGFYDSGKTKSDREKIVSKATTKPQRIAMVEKLFSAKKMNAGGMASSRADGIAIRGKTRA